MRLVKATELFVLVEYVKMKWGREQGSLSAKFQIVLARPTPFYTNHQGTKRHCYPTEWMHGFHLEKKKTETF